MDITLSKQDVIEPARPPFVTVADALLGRAIDDEEERWGIWAEGKLIDIANTDAACVKALGERIELTERNTRVFMENNGWILVRISTTHKIVAVLQTYNPPAHPEQPQK